MQRIAFVLSLLEAVRSTHYPLADLVVLSFPVSCPLPESQCCPSCNSCLAATVLSSSHAALCGALPHVRLLWSHERRPMQVHQRHRHLVARPGRVLANAISLAPATRTRSVEAPRPIAFGPYYPRSLRVLLRQVSPRFNHTPT